MLSWRFLFLPLLQPFRVLAIQSLYIQTSLPHIHNIVEHAHFIFRWLIRIKHLTFISFANGYSPSPSENARTCSSCRILKKKEKFCCELKRKSLCTRQRHAYRPPSATASNAAEFRFSIIYYWEAKERKKWINIIINTVRVGGYTLQLELSPKPKPNRRSQSKQQYLSMHKLNGRWSGYPF